MWEKPLLALGFSLLARNFPVRSLSPTLSFAFCPSPEPRAKSQKPRAARKCRVFKILPASLTGSRFYKESFLPAQWNQDFTGYRGRGVWNPYSLFAVRSGLWRERMANGKRG